MLNHCIKSICLRRCSTHRKFFFNKLNVRHRHVLVDDYEKIPLTFSICNYFNKIYYKLHKECSLNPLPSLHQSRTASMNSGGHDEKESVEDNGAMSISKATRLCIEKFESEDIPEAELHALYIVAHVTGINKHDLELNQSSMLSSSENNKLNSMMECRLARMPLQYIIGDWDFHSINLKLRPPVFIPRMETEKLVELALEELDKYGENGHPLSVLDICCGSGAIALSILKNNSKVKCFALDKSKYAIDLCNENAGNLGLSERLSLVHAEITDSNFPPEVQSQKFDLIISNPPYVPRKDILGMQKEILLYEDMQAIDGGDEGLEIIKPILRHCQHLLSKNGAILMEVDPSHPNLISKWISSLDNVVNLQIDSTYKDNNGLDRYLKLTLKGS